jgi:hypothetical protein
MPVGGELAEEWELFFEEVLEGLAGIVEAGRGSSGNRGSLLSGLRVGSRSGVFLDSHAKFVKLAAVFGVLGGDAFGNGLRTLELGRAIEEAALLAAVKFEIALWTLAVRVKAGGENGAAIGTAAARNGADHTRRAGAELIGTRATRSWSPLEIFVAFIAFIRVAIASMTVLAIHKTSVETQLWAVSATTRTSALILRRA